MQEARIALGLPVLQGGASSDQLQRRTRGTELFAKHDRPVHYESSGRRLVPTEEVWKDWRFLSIPSHAEIRLVAREGYLSTGAVATFTTRGSHLPSLTVLFGSLEAVQEKVKQHYRHHRGLYVLRRAGKNYAGQTREFGTRARSHHATGADLVLFAFPNEAQLVSSDALNVAESLTIVTLSELLALENVTRGHDAPPQPQELRDGAGFALAFLAAITRWAHNRPEQATEFLHWRTDVQGLRDAYLSLTPYEVQL